MRADARVQSSTVDNVACIQATGSGVTVQPIEVGNPHRKIGFGKQLNRLCLGTAGEQYR